jgi:hypothetical protein
MTGDLSAKCVLTFQTSLSGYQVRSTQVRRSLRLMRQNNDVRGVLGVLETCLRTNFAGIESARLYSEVCFTNLYMVLNLKQLDLSK